VRGVDRMRVSGGFSRPAAPPDRVARVACGRPASSSTISHFSPVWFTAWAERGDGKRPLRRGRGRDEADRLGVDLAGSAVVVAVPGREALDRFARRA
jgi:hypothetical protein